MKTAVSLPDDVFEAAEKLAARLGMSRSELYRRAVEAFVSLHARHGIREKLDEVYGDQDSSLDPVVAALQLASLPHEEW